MPRKKSETKKLDIEPAKNLFTLDKVKQEIAPWKHSILEAFLNKEITTIYLMGGKSTGKTWILALLGVAAMETYPYFHWIALKEYKTQASARFGEQIVGAVNDMKLRGYDFPCDYNSRQGYVERERFKRNRLKNQVVLFGSFEGYDDLAALRPTFGTMMFNLIDEPASKSRHKIPADEDWVSDSKSIKSNISRSIPKFKNNFIDPKTGERTPRQPAPIPHLPSVPPPSDEFFSFLRYVSAYALNPWGTKHKLIKDIYVNVDENDWIDYVIGFKNAAYLIEDPDWVKENWDAIVDSLYEHHTKDYYFPSPEDTTKTAFLQRSTIFANPDNRYGEKYETNLADTKKALLENSGDGLARMLGFVHDSNEDSQNAHNFSNPPSEQNFDWLEYMETPNPITGHCPEIEKVSMCLDVDTSRRITIQIVLVTSAKLPITTRLISPPTVFITTNIPMSNTNRARTNYFAKKAYEAIKELSLYFAPKCDIVVKASVDDQNQGYISLIEKAAVDATGKPDVENYITGKLKRTIRNGKNNHWSKNKRKTFIDELIELEYLLIDYRNTELIWTLENIQKKYGKNSSVETYDESGKFEKLMDTMDALFGAVYEVRHTKFQ